jgi:hypothetical protein
LIATGRVRTAPSVWSVLQRYRSQAPRQCQPCRPPSQRSAAPPLRHVQAHIKRQLHTNARTQRHRHTRVHAQTRVHARAHTHAHARTRTQSRTRTHSRTPALAPIGARTLSKSSSLTRAQNATHACVRAQVLLPSDIGPLVLLGDTLVPEGLTLRLQPERADGRVKVVTHTRTHARSLTRMRSRMDAHAHTRSCTCSLRDLSDGAGRCRRHSASGRDRRAVGSDEA